MLIRDWSSDVCASVRNGELLPAFDRLAQRGVEIRNLIDRHVGAFISVRFKGALGSELRDVDNRSNPYVSLVAAVRVLALIQERVAPRSFPHLSALAATLLEPAVDRYHRDRKCTRLNSSH